MSRIKKLAPEEISKIAAGEVVERPANVVKELIENALDAQATEITVHIVDGGKRSIQIIDNGCGMDAEDARACFEHHATSKLTSVLDLPQVSTFGFRGEALSSIAAVSEVTLITRISNTEVAEGIKLTLNGGTIVDQQPISCNTGTSITVNNLFFNIPARKKFLRSTETEWNQITQLFQSFALNYPTISWSLYHGQTLTYRCPPVPSLLERVSQLWDHALGTHCMAIQGDSNSIQIEGVISNHQYHRFDRGRIFFFVNKRWVKNQHLGRALIKGYTNILPQGQYPFACISLTVPTHEVDINVHPRKEEVSFVHPRIIEQAIQMQVQAALQNHVSALLKPKGHTVPTFSDAVFTPGPSSYAQNLSGSNARDPLSTHEHNRPPVPFVPPIQQSFNYSESWQSLAIPQATDITVPSLSFEVHSIIGQFSSTYIMLEHPQGLLLIDQHAAHERVLYERFIQRFEGYVSTKLLFPQMVHMGQDEIALLTPYLAILQAEGIEIEQAGANQLLVTALPMAGKQLAVEGLLKELASWIIENRQIDSGQIKNKIIHQMRAMMACKAAVKAGDVLNRQQMEQLLTDLQSVPNRVTCPHGRPTSWLLPLNEIERKFKRRL